MKHTLQEMYIHHVNTSHYHPQGDFKVEQFPWELHDVMSKKVSDSIDTWDICLNQVLAAIRFSNNKSTKFSPFYLLSNCDPVLPIDNTLKPRRRYQGEEPQKIGLEQQHKSFVMVQQHLKKAVRRQARYADNNSQHTEFQVGVPVYLKDKQQQAKVSYKVDGVLIMEWLQKQHLSHSILRTS